MRAWSDRARGSVTVHGRELELDGLQGPIHPKPFCDFMMFTKPSKDYKEEAVTQSLELNNRRVSVPGHLQITQ